MVWFILFTEPGAGSDANSGKTLAKLSDDKVLFNFWSKNMDIKCWFC